MNILLLLTIQLKIQIKRIIRGFEKKVISSPCGSFSNAERAFS